MQCPGVNSGAEHRMGAVVVVVQMSRRDSEVLIEPATGGERHELHAEADTQDRHGWGLGRPEQGGFVSAGRASVWLWDGVGWPNGSARIVTAGKNHSVDEAELSRMRVIGGGIRGSPAAAMAVGT